jgi:titin
MEVGVYIFATQSQFIHTPGSLVAGNLIGTDVSGQKALGNNVGVYINGVPGNVIGGSTPGARNLISANQVGVYLLGTTATGNQIQGNYFGTSASGNAPLGNHIGIFASAASSNTIDGNIIAGNLVVRGEGSTGIYLFNGASNTTITANSIGTSARGKSSRALAMGDYGVLLYNAPNNAIAKSRGTNRIVGSGIANIREFTGPVPAKSTKSKSVPAGPVALKPKVARTRAVR